MALHQPLDLKHRIKTSDKKKSIPKKKLKQHELQNIDYVRRMERKQEFHFHHFFTLLGGAISNDALIVINDSFVDLFPKAKQWEENRLWENNIYERFMSTR